MKTDGETKRVLPISNSTLYGGGYLDHAEGEIRDFLGGVGRVLFVPYALYDRDAYSSTARERFNTMWYGLDAIHTAADARRAVTDAEAVFVGGGNTFRLLKSLYDFDLLDVIRRRRGFCNSSKRTTRRSSVCAKGRWCASSTGPRS